MRALPCLVFSLLVACNAYDEDYGFTPFLCGDTEPRCPDQYTCQDDITTGESVCVATGEMIDTEFDCADDSSIEPNNMLDTATPTTAMFSQAGNAICPAGDKDVFAINITTTSSVEVVLDFQPNGGPLDAAILNAGGIPIATSVVESGIKVRATSQNLPAGMYYAQVAGTVGVAVPLNNYAITITIDAP